MGGWVGPRRVESRGLGGCLCPGPFAWRPPRPPHTTTPPQHSAPLSTQLAPPHPTITNSHKLATPPLTHRKLQEEDKAYFEEQQAAQVGCWCVRVC